ncbi:hypothetical protein COLO4_24331 [Corchorus olitorius]|uniref:Uncharacterized protein n=1 Tax=Corchorus olitorius TaxID=93759 RepID=A0A1R3IB62_9ROSI|nr:hypothetical protein COLO4_24331 [Corchorus olitorius]
MMPDGSSCYSLSESGIDLIEIPPKSYRSTLYRTGLGLSERKSPPWGETWTILGKWKTGAKRVWQKGELLTLGFVFFFFAFCLRLMRGMPVGADRVCAVSERVGTDRLVVLASQVLPFSYSLLSWQIPKALNFQGPIKGCHVMVTPLFLFYVSLFHI